MSAESIQRLWALTLLTRIKRYPVTSSAALAEFKAALTMGRYETALKGSSQEMSGRSIRIKNTQRIRGVRAMRPNVKRSNLRCIK